MTNMYDKGPAPLLHTLGCSSGAWEEHDLIDIRRKGEKVDGRSLKVSFERTVRVSDNGSTNDLPPDFGSFPLHDISKYQDNNALPTAMKAKGGYFLPMYQREAMWISFQSRELFAVKIHIGGVNAISGESSLETETTDARRYKLLSEKKIIQDYIVTPQQLWLDGVASSDGAVRQFVAVPIRSGYSVEAQITGDDLVGGLQLEIIPVKERFSVVHKPSYFSQNSASANAESAKTSSIQVYIRSLTGKTLLIDTTSSDTIDKLKSLVQKKEGIPPDRQRMIYGGKYLEDARTLHDYRINNGCEIHLAMRLCGGGHLEPEMGIGASGMIKQTILRDNTDPTIWDTQSGTIINVQILNSSVLEAVTHCAPPATPVTAEVYEMYGFPYFDIYNESPSGVKGDFEGVKSVAEKDSEGPPTLEKALAVAEVIRETKNPVILLDQAGKHVGFRPVKTMERELVEKFGKLDFTNKPGSKRKSS